MSSGRGSRRVTVTLLALAILLVLAAAIGALILDAKTLPLVVVSAGLALPLLLHVLASRFGYRRVLLAFGLLLVSGLGVVCGLAVVFTNFGQSPPGALVTATVVYRGQGHLDGASMEIEERIVLDETVMELLREHARDEFDELTGDPSRSKNIDVDQMAISGWKLAATVDGKPVYERTRSVAVEQSALAVVTVPVEVEIGDLQARAGDDEEHILVEMTLVPRDESTFMVSAPKGAIAATYPPADVVDNLRTGESATIGLTYTDEFSVRLMPPILRNPAGGVAYQIISWGPLTWLLGSVALLVGSLLVESLRTSIAKLAGRFLVRPLRERLGHSFGNDAG
jgi:hypothetical protein